jgi:hypothetical protein
MIVFDAPRRIAPGRDLPILLLLHHIDRYPVTCRTVDIAVTQPGRAPLKFTYTDAHTHCTHQWTTKSTTCLLFVLSRCALYEGTIYITAAAHIAYNGRTRVVINNNLRSAGAQALCCHIATHDLPGVGRCVYGDLHVHSDASNTRRFVAPPVAVTDRMAHAFGLHVLGITDHSYTLTAEKWHTGKDSLDTFSGRTCILQGEEVSATNARTHTVHMCALAADAFIAGCKDGTVVPAAQGGPDVETSARAIHTHGGLCFAAHPGAVPSMLYRILLRRGSWHEQDISGDIDGLQAVTGAFDAAWTRAKRLWIRLLLRGFRLSLIAGNDTHGDFSRLRVAGPLLRDVREYQARFLGSTRTGIYLDSCSRDDVTHALAGGKTFVTDGPFLCICKDADARDIIVATAGIRADRTDGVYVHAAGTPEVGALEDIRLVHGEYEHREERTVGRYTYTDTVVYTACVRFDLNARFRTPGYLRAEVTCRDRTGTRYTRAFTSPCYLY